MTPSRSSVARTSPASGSPTCSPRSCSGRAWAPTWSSPPATSPTTGRCREAATATTAIRSWGRATKRRWTSCSRPTAALLARLTAWIAERFATEPGASPAAHERAVHAKALDLLRGLLPAASLSHVGIFASGQTFERLILHLRAHPLPEARRCGEQMLAAMRVAAPSFVTRVERPDRGGEWVEFLTRRSEAQRRAAQRLGLGSAGAGRAAPARGCCGSRAMRPCCSRRCCSSSPPAAKARPVDAVARLGEQERRELLGELLGGRGNRRHLPGRGLEALRYRFEIVSDYGAFRDLQRHRMLTAQWQTLTPHLGAEVPEELDDAGLGDQFRAALERSRGAWQELLRRGPRGTQRPTPFASPTGSATCSI